ncbi:MAG: DNA mismatch repair endonuclease MutL [Dehalococcoidales bacterium]|nr:DNA mismatch repair endonuclease MutL [Dehalococcoidales bacterium]
MPIKLLDPEIISRIAAGEVVERPASVVKELVENSLDAGSSRITIEVRGGGVSLIRVSDDGQGIPSGEMEIAFQRHATSKIARLDDLESISSLGFRGEALPSIAAVSQVDMASCAAGESAGSYLSLQEGVVSNRGSQGHPQGTTITVRNLLRNVPARLKFLKSPATENSHIADVVSQYALAFPEVKFSLSIDERTVLRTPGSDQLIDSVIAVYGLKGAQNMLEVGGGEREWEGGTANSSPRVTGMVGSPMVSRSGRGYLSFFVNRRWINSRLLSWAVEEAYHGLLMTGKHPLAIINLALPPQDLDVNVHPTKIEVKFQNERLVFQAVQKAVRQALIALAPVPKIEEVATAYGAPAARQPLTPSVGASHHTISPALVAQPTPAFSLPALRLLGQLTASYIIAEGPDGLYLIDQHAAHERILFEQIQQQRARQQIEVQGLLPPATLEVNPQQDTVLKSQYESLAEFGFAIEPFGKGTYLVRAVPVLLHRQDWAGVLRELLDSPPGGNKSDWREKVAITIACHSAVRAGQILSDDEMRALLRQLESAALPNTCPHGRPTMIHLDSGQLEREFGRS